MVIKCLGVFHSVVRSIFAHIKNEDDNMMTVRYARGDVNDCDWIVCVVERLYLYSETIKYMHSSYVCRVKRVQKRAGRR